MSLQPGKATKEYCAFLGISDTKFHRIVALYNEQGGNFCETLQWGGRRESRCQLSFEQEEELLQTQIATALQGGVLVAKQLKEAAGKKAGHSVSDDYLWGLLSRHGWRKKAPRPEHPKATDIKEKREAVKKKHLNSFAQKPTNKTCKSVF